MRVVLAQVRIKIGDLVQAPVALRTRPEAFGAGRRIPIVRRVGGEV